MTDGTDTNDSATQLKTIVDRIETLEEEKKDVSEQIKEVYSEAKGNGFDTKALRTVIRKRRQDRAELEAQESIVETYEAALGA